MRPAATGVVLDSRLLLPDAWSRLAGNEPIRAFNPGLLRDGEQWLFAYRMVLADNRRRIALCHLDRGFGVAAGSALPLSDAFQVRTDRGYAEQVHHWFADPRLYRFGRRLFVYWNSGWHEPQNEQFLQELDPATYQPIGYARALRLRRGGRRPLEKNWTLFSVEGGSRILALYSLTPLRILSANLDGEDDISFDEVAQHDVILPAYPACHGGLRGGAPAVEHAGVYTVFCHSVHDSPEGYRYAAAAFEFGQAAPFAPTAVPTAPLPLFNPQGASRSYPRLNPAVGEVIYPCGAAREAGDWVISHGINDEHCAISRLPATSVTASLAQVGRT